MSSTLLIKDIKIYTILSEKNMYILFKFLRTHVITLYGHANFDWCHEIGCLLQCVLYSVFDGNT